MLTFARKAVNERPKKFQFVFFARWRYFTIYLWWKHAQQLWSRHKPAKFAKLQNVGYTRKQALLPEAPLPKPPTAKASRTKAHTLEFESTDCVISARNCWLTASLLRQATKAVNRYTVSHNRSCSERKPCHKLVRCQNFGKRRTSEISIKDKFTTTSDKSRQQVHRESWPVADLGRAEAT